MQKKGHDVVFLDVSEREGKREMRNLGGVWYIHLKTYVLLFENMCENTCNVV